MKKDIDSWVTVVTVVVVLWILAMFVYPLLLLGLSADWLAEGALFIASYCLIAFTVLSLLFILLAPKTTRRILDRIASLVYGRTS